MLSFNSHPCVRENLDAVFYRGFIDNKVDHYWLYRWQCGDLLCCRSVGEKPTSSVTLSEKQGGDGCLSITTIGVNHGDNVSKTSKAKLSVSIQYSFLTYVKRKKITQITIWSFTETMERYHWGIKPAGDQENQDTSAAKSRYWRMRKIFPGIVLANYM